SAQARKADADQRRASTSMQGVSVQARQEKRRAIKKFGRSDCSERPLMRRITRGVSSPKRDRRLAQRSSSGLAHEKTRSCLSQGQYTRSDHLKPVSQLARVSFLYFERFAEGAQRHVGPLEQEVGFEDADGAAEQVLQRSTDREHLFGRTIKLQ